MTGLLKVHEGCIICSVILTLVLLYVLKASSRHFCLILQMSLWKGRLVKVCSRRHFLRWGWLKTTLLNGTLLYFTDHNSFYAVLWLFFKLLPVVEYLKELPCWLHIWFDWGLSWGCLWNYVGFLMILAFSNLQLHGFFSTYSYKSRKNNNSFQFQLKKKNHF